MTQYTLNHTVYNSMAEYGASQVSEDGTLPFRLKTVGKPIVNTTESK